MPFHSTEAIQLTSTPKSSEKIREDRKLCTLYFCITIGCKGAFEKKQDYDVHVLHGNHEIVKECDAMDTVRKSFISKMKSLSNCYAIYTSEVRITDTDLISASKEVPLMSMFAEPAWALPVRNNFGYSYKQKKFLYDRFIEGELSGKKKSPEQVHLDMRKEFAPSQYVTVQQIKSLFSRMSQEKRRGTLQEPTTNNKEEIEVESMELQTRRGRGARCWL